MQDKKKGKKNDTAKDSLSHLDMDTVRASSAGDCTGLIPAALNSQAEEEAYEELYHFGANIQE